MSALRVFTKTVDGTCVHSSSGHQSRGQVADGQNDGHIDVQEQILPNLHLEPTRGCPRWVRV